MKLASAILRTPRLISTTRLIVRPTLLSRHYHRMNTMEPDLQSPLFTQQVVKAMQTLYPEELADRAWDNVGLLQENIDPASGTVPPRVLLTNDLTIRVSEEAIQKKASVIVSYHPFIFRGIKSLRLNDPHQRIILRLAQHNIAVYSPHTAADAVLGGVNDWLMGVVKMILKVQQVTVLNPIMSPVPPGFEGAGYGRQMKLASKTGLRSIVQAICQELGVKHITVAQPKTPDGGENYIRSIAVCAGSGYDVLKNADADLIITGEMSHHNALRLKMLGKSVITLFHSNSERGFLKQVLQPQLSEMLQKENKEAEVLVSVEDEDPFEILQAT